MEKSVALVDTWGIQKYIWFFQFYNGSANLTILGRFGLFWAVLSQVGFNKICARVNARLRHFRNLVRLSKGQGDDWYIFIPFVKFLSLLR